MVFLKIKKEEHPAGNGSVFAGFGGTGINFQGAVPLIKVAILAPINNSLYSLNTTCLLTQLKDVEVVGIVVRTPWNQARIRSELRRDGVRLMRKVINKWLLRDVPRIMGWQKRYCCTVERDQFTVEDT